MKHSEIDVLFKYACARQAARAFFLRPEDEPLIVVVFSDERRREHAGPVSP